MADLKLLQEQHQEYSKRVKQNEIDIEGLTQAIADYKDEIRDMEIDLRDTLNEAFEDMADLQEQMLDSRVEMEDEIFSVIEERYQKEWDLLKEDIDKKKEAYNEEMGLIRERLNERKNAAEEADKYQQLADYERQYAILLTDPTRAKDQQDMLKKIADLREELAWSSAEAEATAQEESIQQQIDSLDDYADSLADYYNDIFDNPDAITAEMLAVLEDANEDIKAYLMANKAGFSTMSKEEQDAAMAEMYQMAYATDEALLEWMEDNITGFSNMNATQQETLMDSVRTMAEDADDYVIDWLKANSEDFATSTAARQAQMEQAWRDTMLAMHGATKTNWAAIEDLIKQGDDAIIAFLKKNSADYKAAGKLQSEAYVDEWKKKLSDLKAAYKEAQDYMADTAYVPIDPTPPTSDDPPGGGSNGGGAYYKFGYKNSVGKWIETAKDKDVAKAFANAVTAGLAHWTTKLGNPGVPDVLRMIGSSTVANPGSYLKKYKKGGKVDQTGLVEVHGTTTDPEAFLSAKDTRGMRQFLDVFTGVMVPSRPSLNYDSGKNNQSSFNIDSITVQVDKLETDQDYELVAERVARALYRNLTIKSGVAVSGGSY